MSSNEPEITDASRNVEKSQLNLRSYLEPTDENAPDWQTSPKESQANPVDVLLNSAAYAGFQSPLNGALQVFDADRKKGLLAPDSPWQFFKAPEKSDPWTVNWNADQIGTGLGMVVPLYFLHKGLRAICPNEAAKIATKQGVQFLTTAERASLMRYEVSLAAGTGALFGGAFSPSHDAVDMIGLGHHRRNQAISGAATFATMATLGIGVKSATSQIEAKTMLDRLVKGDTFAMAVAGIPSGVVAVDLPNLMAGKGPATFDEHLQSVYNFTVLGAGLGKVLRVGKRADVMDLDLAVRRSGEPEQRVATTDRHSQALASNPEGGLAIKVPDLNMEPAKVGEIPVTYERGLQTMPRLKEGVILPERFASQSEFEALALGSESVPVRKYRSPKVSTEVIIPEEYAVKLERVAELKEQVARGGSDSQRAAIELAKPEWAELKDRMTAQDAFQQILMTPRPSRFEKVIISDKANAYDAWYASEHQTPDFTSAADSKLRTGETTWYKRDRGPVLLEDTTHEWVHHEEVKNPLDAAAYHIASRLEDPSWPRAYAATPKENYAITLGEYALHKDGARVGELIAKAPLRAAALGDGMRKMLADLPPAERGALHDQLVERADIIANAAQPMAVKRLLELAKEPEGPHSDNAIKLLLTLGTVQDLGALTHVTSLDLSFEAITDAQGVKLPALRNLTDLNLSNTHVTSQTTRVLESLPLVSLNLRNTKINNAGLTNLPQTLTNLDVSNTLIGEPVIPSIVRLRNLTELDVSGTKISFPARQRLADALPSTEIID